MSPLCLRLLVASLPLPGGRSRSATSAPPPAPILPAIAPYIRRVSPHPPSPSVSATRAGSAPETPRREITTPEELPEEGVIELSLRPQRLSEFIGQPKVKESLRIYIDAAIARREPLDHTLFFGPPGLGKTTLAELIAREVGANIHSKSGPSLEKPGDLVGTLTNLRAGDVLFIDEIHRLRPSSKSSSIPRWRTSRSRSAFPTDRRRKRSLCRSSGSPWSAPPPAWGCSLHPSGPDSVSSSD